MNDKVIVDRSKLLGGSDIPALLGIAPKSWKRNTPLALYFDKITPPSNEERAPQLKRGHRWESVVAEMLVESLISDGHTVEIISHNKRYTDETEPSFACEIDYEIKLDGSDEITNVELKTVHPFKAKEWGEEMTDEAPIHYIAQVMWGLGITGRKQCVLAALFGADYIKPYFIDRDDDLIEQLRIKAHTFWYRHVQNKIPPDPMTLEDLARLFPADKLDVAVEAAMGSDLHHKILQARAVKAMIEARENEMEVLEFELKRAMGECSQITLADKVACTWKSRDFSWLDQSALKEAEPKLHKQYMRKEPRRVFLLK